MEAGNAFAPESPALADGRNDLTLSPKSSDMGKGDKRSKRGKIWRGSFGNSRPKASQATPGPTPKA